MTLSTDPDSVLAEELARIPGDPLGLDEAIEKALNRANFYLNTFSLQEALYGVEHGVAAAFYAGIARYRSEEE